LKLRPLPGFQLPDPKSARSGTQEQVAVSQPPAARGSPFRFSPRRGVQSQNLREFVTQDLAAMCPRRGVVQLARLERRGQKRPKGLWQPKPTPLQNGGAPQNRVR